MNQHSRPVYRIAPPIKTLAQRFAYLGLVLTAFGLMLLGKADAFLIERFRAQVIDAIAPILDAASRPVATVSEVVEEARELAVLRAENSRLREERARLLQWQTIGRRLEAENRALRKLLRFTPREAKSYVTARIIADSGGTFAHSLIMNAGLRDRIRRGQAVITGEGLVGRVVGVGSRSARVLLITDLNSRIPVVTETTRTRGILAGDNTQRPMLVHLPPGASVSTGERIVTSGHGGMFPSGLPVGVVASVSDGGIVVQPFVSADRLEYVRAVDIGLEGGVKLSESSDNRSVE